MIDRLNKNQEKQLEQFRFAQLNSFGFFLLSKFDHPICEETCQSMKRESELIE